MEGIAWEKASYSFDRHYVILTTSQNAVCPHMKIMWYQMFIKALCPLITCMW